MLHASSISLHSNSLTSGLFLIDGKGVLRSMIVNDLPVGRSVTETLRLIKAFQFADEHGTTDLISISCDRLFFFFLKTFFADCN